jgi:endonuclease/exonuclease/phosphatase family metal-dependent hydrolase
MAPFAQDATLLIGDFNMTTKAVEFQGLFGKNPFQDAFLLSKSAPYINAQKTTLTAWTKLVGNGSHIDHIFVRYLGDVLDYQVPDEQYPVAKTMIYPSDHLPVLSRVCLPGL